MSLVESRSARNKYIWRNIPEHVLIIERTLGREIRRPISIHHVDGNGRNNARSNLVVCPNHAYHALLHMRTEAIKECGNPNWRKCDLCKKWDAPENLAFWRRNSARGTVIQHKECANERNRKYKTPEIKARYNENRRKAYANSRENTPIKEGLFDR